MSLPNLSKLSHSRDKKTTKTDTIIVPANPALVVPFPIPQPPIDPKIVSHGLLEERRSYPERLWDVLPQDALTRRDGWQNELQFELVGGTEALRTLTASGNGDIVRFQGPPGNEIPVEWKSTQGDYVTFSEDGKSIESMSMNERTLNKIAVAYPPAMSTQGVLYEGSLFETVIESLPIVESFVDPFSKTGEFEMSANINDGVLSFDSNAVQQKLPTQYTWEDSRYIRGVNAFSFPVDGMDHSQAGTERRRKEIDKKYPPMYAEWGDTQLKHHKLVPFEPGKTKEGSVGLVAVQSNGNVLVWLRSANGDLVFDKAGSTGTLDNLPGFPQEVYPFVSLASFGIDTTTRDDESSVALGDHTKAIKEKYKRLRAAALEARENAVGAERKAAREKADAESKVAREKADAERKVEREKADTQWAVEMEKYNDRLAEIKKHYDAEQAAIKEKYEAERERRRANPTEREKWEDQWEDQWGNMWRVAQSAYFLAAMWACMRATRVDPNSNGIQWERPLERCVGYVIFTEIFAARGINSAFYYVSGFPPDA